jgi:hypothetical protein
MKCLTPECRSEEIYSRGLCRRCYRRLYQRVARGTARWYDLIEQGLAKKVAMVGPTTETRKAAQRIKRTKGNPMGLDSWEIKHLVVQAKQILANPEQYTEANLQKQREFLELYGNGTSS